MLKDNKLIYFEMEKSFLPDNRCFNRYHTYTDISVPGIGMNTRYRSNPRTFPRGYMSFCLSFSASPRFEQASLLFCFLLYWGGSDFVVSNLALKKCWYLKISTSQETERGNKTNTKTLMKLELKAHCLLMNNR